MTDESKLPAPLGPVERGVSGPAPERPCSAGCNGCDDCTYYGSDDMYDRDSEPAGCYECAYGKVLGCWKCGWM